VKLQWILHGSLSAVPNPYMYACSFVPFSAGLFPILSHIPLHLVYLDTYACYSVSLLIIGFVLSDPHRGRQLRHAQDGVQMRYDDDVFI
jgi:hypothetical protein